MTSAEHHYKKDHASVQHPQKESQSVRLTQMVAILDCFGRGRGGGGARFAH